MDFSINIKEIFTAFMVLFAVIDITGSTPIIIGLNDAGKKVSAEKAAGISLVIFIAFLFAGDEIIQHRYFLFCPCRGISAFRTRHRNDL